MAPSRRGPSISLRPARPEDEAFLQAVYFSTREEELRPVPWTDEQKRSFLLQQHTAQSRDYRTNYPAASFDVIMTKGERVGRLYVDRRETEVRIVDIALLPRFRRRGIGGTLIRRLLREAHLQGKPVTIHVERNNPARELYERLGFRVVGESEVYLLMEAAPRS